MTKPDLTNYDWIIVGNGAGKDAQCLLQVVYEQARAAGLQDRLVVAHSDLGRAQWSDVHALAKAHADHYGVRFESITRRQGDPLQQIAASGVWPAAHAAYLIRDHKRDQIKRIMTKLVRERWDGNRRQAIRILNCTGTRAEEQRTRERRSTFVQGVYDNGRREIDEWLPIYDLTEAEVWDCIRSAGTKPHWSYAKGSRRISYFLALHGAKPEQVLAASLNPCLFEEYLELERRLGKPFKPGLSLQMIADVVREKADPASESESG
jgi:DNA sulfur modification protein DndC